MSEERVDDADLRRMLETADRLPTLPAVALEVLNVTRDEDASIEQLAYTVARDPALSARLLRVANSSMFRRGQPVTSLLDATMRLGLKTVKLMALSFCLADAIPRNSTPRFDYVSFWRHSLVMTVAARSLARLVRSRFEDEAFVCGLLSHIGELVIAECMPERWAEVNARAEAGLATPAIQREVLGFDHHRIGALLLQAWQLPQLIWAAVQHYGEPAGIPDGSPAAVRELADLLNLAESTALLICSEERGAALATLEEIARDRFAMSPTEIEAFVIGLEGGIVETAMLLNVRMPSVDGHQALLEQARKQLMDISLGAVVDLHEAKRRAEELEEQNRELSIKANTDALTGLPNRAGFDEYLGEVLRARLEGRGRHALGLLMLDVDHFKRFNDEFGHPAGDAVLRRVAQAIASQVRGDSFAARYGGEEFVVVLPNVTLEHVEAIAERVRLAVQDSPITIDGRKHAVTISVGGACLERVPSIEVGARLVGLADDCLYEAKRGGRNCSVCRRVEVGAVA